MASESTRWETIEERPLTGRSLRDLFDNKIPVIRIRDFATPAECTDFVAALDGANMKYYSVDPPIGYVGQAQYEFRWNRKKSDYIRAAADAYDDLNYVTSRSFDPVQRLIDRLSPLAAGPVGIAEEEGHGRYFAGIIRKANDGVAMHADFAPFNTPTYGISRIDAQLGWNLFAEVPGSGGVTTIYNRPWTPVMEADIPPQSYDLPLDIVEGADAFEYSGEPGSVVLFNSRNPHLVSAGGAGSGDRISIGSFVGRMPDGALVLWA